ncbi:MAG: helix-turn-helix domain-containing protein [Solirubrobacterales bacterium]
MPRGGDSKTVRILEVDPDLGARLDPSTRERATAELQAQVSALEPGEWEPSRSPSQAADLGLLMLSGLMSRHLDVAEARSVELLSAGDLLRPWQEDAVSFVRADWQVLERVEIALLSEDFALRAGRYPALFEALIDRAMRRSRSLAVHSAIDNIVGLETSLELLFWQLAERWGRVEQGGVVIHMRLTHQMLADLVGARRPSVTSALRELAQAGTLTSISDGGWRLTGSPPAVSGGEP